jgi:hypothetical protein
LSADSRDAARSLHIDSSSAASIGSLRIVISALPLLLFLAFLATSAEAETPAYLPGVSGPTGPAAHEGAYVHDGFYFRISGGFSAYDERLASNTRASGEFAARSRGIASSSDLAIGGTFAPGWVLGGGVFTVDLLASTLRTRRNTTGANASTAGDSTASDSALIPAELDPGLRDLVLIGPFLDWYPNPRGGFHALGALGVSLLTPRVFGDSATQQSKYLAVGGGLILGTGYDVWVDEEWSIGVLGQLGISILGGKDDAGDAWTHVITTSPSLSIEITYH